MSTPAQTPGDRGTFRRDESLRRLADEPFDVVVVGGGVTGAGVALDAASRGLRTVLVEKGDFGSGTSSKSSKLIHGGLRYLQQREVGLVYESLAERQHLLENAPHLVTPIPFLIPLFGHDGVVSKTLSRTYATVLWLYDITGGLRIGKRHRRVKKAEALAHMPTLRTDRLVAGFLYWDARADDARLTLALVRTAVLDHRAVAANYTEATGLLVGADDRVDGVTVRPRPRPGSTVAGEIEIRARVVVNATGVWADDLRALDEGTHPQSLRPAKGIHVTLPAAKLPVDVAAVLPVPGDRRSIFVLPWPEGGLVYVGATDTAYDGPLDDPRCTPEDVDYLLDAVNAATTSGVTRQDVTGVWAGLRPLLAPGPSGKSRSERTADLSRRHSVRTSRHGLVTVTGGKLTTYRKMAEDTMAQVVGLLPADRGAGPCVTKALRLRGAPNPETAPQGTDGAVRARMLARYGTEAPDVLALAEGRPELLDPVVEGLAYLGCEVVYAARAEMATSVDDVLSRRTRALLQAARASAEAATRVAELLGPELGWSPEEAAAQAAEFSRTALGDPVGRRRPHHRAHPVRPVITPTPPTPVDADAVTDRLGAVPAAVDDRLLEQIAASGAEVRTGHADLTEAGRDWWPLAVGWAARGQVPMRPSAVVRPADVAQVSATLAACSAAGVPVTAMSGRSGVCGGSVPVFGGISLDCTALVGPVVVDEASLLADVPAGLFGPDLERDLAAVGEGYTLGHFPQSWDLSTVGGWLACRGAGQYSTRYGKIEDMVVGLEVVLADGTVMRTEGTAPRTATGPNLTQLFVGSEGTLGVITSARLRVHPRPAAEGRRAFSFPSFASGLEACRRILRRGATPAVLRLYDHVESLRNFDHDRCLLVVLDEADPGLLHATLEVVDQECAAAEPVDTELVERWLAHRNDVSALAPLWRADIVVDTAEVAGRWAVLPALADDVVTAITEVPGTLVASVHQSHAYPDGACLYFTFAGRHPEEGPEAGSMDWQEDYYRRAWDAAMTAVSGHGAAISHHHGIGLNRARFMAEALGPAFGVLASVKAALDPDGILNPGKLGLPTRFGEVGWP